MYIIDYLDHFENNTINVSPFHTGHLGLIPDNAEVHAGILKSYKGVGSEVCITPYYPENFNSLFRLKCVLKEDRGVVHKLLKAISYIGLNIISSESVTLESKKGHGVSLLLDWSVTDYRKQLTLSENVSNLFFPLLSNIIPSNDRRYLILLRQILGQCADILDWTDADNNGISFPRIKMVEFDETRVIVGRSSNVSILRPKGREKKRKTDKVINRQKIIDFCKSKGINFLNYVKPYSFKEMLNNAGIQAKFEPNFLEKIISKTGRNSNDKIPFITLSDIESKTLRLFIPLKQVEKRIINISLSHKNISGALFVITKLLADNHFSIYSSLVRTFNPKNPNEERNVFEAMIEHEYMDIEKDLLKKDKPELWIKKFLKVGSLEKEIKYFDIQLEKPQYPSGLNFKSTALSPIKELKNYHFEAFKEGDEENDIKNMKEKFEKNEMHYKNQIWLTNLLFSKEWSQKGLPTVFFHTQKRHLEMLNTSWKN